jgi:hypothetical protein
MKSKRNSGVVPKVPVDNKCLQHPVCQLGLWGAVLGVHLLRAARRLRQLGTSSGKKPIVVNWDLLKAPIEMNPKL